VEIAAIRLIDRIRVLKLSATIRSIHGISVLFSLAEVFQQREPDPREMFDAIV
jgi:hypothetical protein